VETGVAGVVRVAVGVVVCTGVVVGAAVDSAVKIGQVTQQSERTSAIDSHCSLVINEQ